MRQGDRTQERVDVINRVPTYTLCPVVNYRKGIRKGLRRPTILWNNRTNLEYPKSES